MFDWLNLKTPEAMKTIVEKVDISITTKNNALPTKPVAGRFRIAPSCDVASFIEEDATIIFGESKRKRIMQGKHCAVYWNPEKGRYRISISIDPTQAGAFVLAECDYEDCVTCIKRKEASR